MAITLRILDRDEDGTRFVAKFQAQGSFDCEIIGFFHHSFDIPNASSWDVDHLNNFGKVNGIEHYPVAEILSLLGNGCMDIGTEVLDDMLAPLLDDDYFKWAEWFENDARIAAEEEKANIRFYERSAI